MFPVCGSLCPASQPCECDSESYLSAILRDHQETPSGRTAATSLGTLSDSRRQGQIERTLLANKSLWRTKEPKREEVTASGSPPANQFGRLTWVNYPPSSFRTLPVTAHPLLACRASEIYRSLHQQQQASQTRIPPKKSSLASCHELPQSATMASKAPAVQLHHEQEPRPRRSKSTLPRLLS